MLLSTRGGDPSLAPAPAFQVPLDTLLVRAAAQRPEGEALVDLPGRERWSPTGSRQLDFPGVLVAADRFGARLRDLGLPVDSVVGIQLANTTEAVIALLGCLRAGLVPALLPLSWRRLDMAAALGRVEAKAIVSATRIGATAHAELAMQVAADVFTIRFVCAFGPDVPDGVIGLNDVFDPGDAPAIASPERPDGALHVAVVTFDIDRDGIVPVPRSHAALVAAGLWAMAEAQVPAESTIASVMAPGSLAGLATGVVPWLLTRGRLVLDQTFDRGRLPAVAEGCASLVVPGALIKALGESSLLDVLAPRSITAVWRSPERLAGAVAWLRPDIRLVDVAAFGEAGLTAVAREASGRPGPIPVGRITAPRGLPGAPVALETSRGSRGTLLVRGAMVPARGLPSSRVSQLRLDPDGWLDTGLPCRPDRTTGLAIEAGEPGIVTVGGWRGPRSAIERLVAEADPEARITDLPDGLLGSRLAGAAADRAAVRSHLLAAGASVPVVAAFLDRRGRP